MAIVKNLMVRAGADFSGLKKEMENAKKSMQSFKTQVSSIWGSIKFTLASLAIGKTIKDSVKSAMEVEAALNQIKRIMGESTSQFLKWADTNAQAFGMAKSEILKYASVYGNLISSFTKSTAETTGYTQELLKTSAIVASATGRTMEDVMERIRSGLLGNTEAIEDVGIYAQVAMLKSTDAFKKLANGKSWEQLDYYTQQQIRLMSILEQANKKYGDSVAQNSALAHAQFIAQLKNVQLSLGQAFLPIYTAVLPALTNLAASLARVMGIVAQFTQALFGKTASSQASQVKTTTQQASAVGGLGDAYKKAGKAAKGALAGFDEINQLADKSGEGGELPDLGGAAAMPEGTMGMNLNTNAPEVSSKIQDMANNVKSAFADMTNFISQNKDLVVSALAGIIAGFASFAIISNWSAIVTAFDLALGAIASTFTGISMPILAASAGIAILIANIVYLWKTNEQFRNSVLEVWTQLKTMWIGLVTDMWSIISGIWDKYGQTLITNLSNFMLSIQNIIITVWEGFLKPIITAALEMLTWLWTEHLSGLVAQVGEFVMKLINGALEIWNGFIAPLVNWLATFFGPRIAAIISFVVDIFASSFAGIIDIAKGLIKALGGIIDFIVGVFTGNWKKAFEGIRDIFAGIFESLVGFVKVPLNYIIDAVNAVIRGLNAIHIDIPDWVPGFGGKTFGISIPTLPKLAKGGITNGEMAAVIGDNPGGREVVSPLSDLMDMISTAVGNAMMAANQFKDNTQPINLNLNIDGVTFARATYQYNENESDRVGDAMIITT